MKLKDKTVLITGATSGIGYETALALAKEGAHMVLAVRNPEKGKSVRQEIMDISQNNQIDLIEGRLDSLESVRNVAEEFRKKYDHLHILINNAGIWETKRRESEDGIELTFAVNHLAPFLLTNLLLSHIKNSTPARIINLASMAHKFGSIHFDDIELTQKWGSMKSYGQSKLCNVLFTKKLAEILIGSGVTANCVHPGVVATKLFEKMPDWMLWPMKPFFISPAKGARTSIFLATNEEVGGISGAYFSKEKVTDTSKEAQDKDVAERLWQLSIDYAMFA